MVVCRNEKSLLQLEKKYNIRRRWDLNSNEVLNAKARLLEKKKSAVLSKLHCMASERSFLLEMKRKYAGENIF
jgi:hypothetical protein